MRKGEGNSLFAVWWYLGDQVNREVFESEKKAERFVAFLATQGFAKRSRIVEEVRPGTTSPQLELFR